MPLFFYVLTLPYPTSIFVHNDSTLFIKETV